MTQSRADRRVIIALGLIFVVTAACGPLFQFGDNYYAVSFRNETTRTLLFFDSPNHQDREQVAKPGATVGRTYRGGRSEPVTVEFWNEDLTLFYCGKFTQDDFARVKFAVVISGPRADC